MDMQPDQTLIPAWRGDVLTAVDKLEVHRTGLRHKAVSVFVVETSMPAPRLLLQRRAMGKYHTPGLWANACCTHPHWGESGADCAERRLAQELGLRGLPLRPAGQVEYRADVGGGLIEHEVVEMFVGAVSGAAEDLVSLDPDPREVMATRWAALPDLEAEIAERPEAFTPWLRIYLAEHRHLVLPA